jgi:chromosome partitioning protein
MRVLAISNQKGGTGKTTTTLNLGAALAAIGRRVLILDLDPQASLTLATVGESVGASLGEVLGDSKPGSLAITQIIKSLSPGLDLAPGDLSLSNSELGIATRMSREWLLQRALAGVKGYDLALIDCGPSLGLLVVNALAAAHGVIAPTLPTALDLRGLEIFIDNLEKIRAELNPGLELLGVLVCQYDSRLSLHKAALADLQAGGLPLLPVIISKSVKAAESTGEGDPIPKGKLAEQYNELAEEVNKWLQKKKENR